MIRVLEGLAGSYPIYSGPDSLNEERFGDSANAECAGGDSLRGSLRGSFRKFKHQHGIDGVGRLIWQRNCNMAPLLLHL
jgi:hypothetical protein